MKKMFTSILLIVALLLTSVPIAPVAEAAVSGYSPSAAISYARAHCTNYNPAYTSWKGRGGDCANFVSQCLFAGGIPKSSAWYPDSVAWINVNSLRNYLNSLPGTKQIIGPNPSDISPGDVVIYSGHATICVETGKVASHTSDGIFAFSYFGKVEYVIKMSDAPFDGSKAPVISVSGSYFRKGENITVSWKPFTNAAKYEYWVSEFPEGYAYETNVLNGFTTETSVYFNNLPAGRYTMFIHAIAPNGDWSAQSNWVEFYVYRTNYFPIKSAVKNGHIYAAFDQSASWDFAKRVCEDMGGHLVTITSAEENDIVTSLLKQGENDAYWIGATNTENTYAGINGYPYFWITGEPFSYSKWNTGEPNGSGGNQAGAEHYAEIRKSYNYNWNDNNNTAKNGFILEIETDKFAPAATSIVGKSKFMLFDESLTWTEAKTYCESIGGHLATPSTKAEDDTVTALLKKGKKPWYYIGASGETGTWKWVDGSAVKLSGDYQNWGNGASGSNKVNGPTGWGNFLMKYKETGRWIGCENLYLPACDVEYMGFVCEVDLASYNVTYNANGGTGAPAAQTKTQSVALTLSGTKPTRTGYTFQGWATSAASTTVAYAAGASYTKDAAVTLYAVWKPNAYTVTYNANGGTGTMANSSHTYGTAKALTANAFTRTGYSFLGWSTSATATAATYTDKQSVNNLTATAGGTVNLYAIWKANAYTVKYNANGGTGTMANSSHTYGTAKALTANAFTRTGYSFLGWSTNASATTATYTDKQSVNNLTATAGGTVNLYAIWKANAYTVKYNANGGTGTMANSSHTYGTAKALTANAFTRTGYSFLGWSTSATATAATYTDKQSVNNLTATAGGTVNLYAIWKVNTYTNTIHHWLLGFKNGEGQNAGQNAYRIAATSFTAAYNASYTMSESYATKLPNGVALINHIGSSSIDGTWKTYALGITVTQKPSVMAFEYDYGPIDYKITYDLAGGTNNSANPATYNVLYGVSLKNPTRTGYIFAGWYNGSTKVTGINEGKNATFANADALYTELAKRQTGDVKLTAKWIANDYTVTYNANGGTGAPAAQTKTHGTALTLSSTKPTRTGYTFQGWATSAASTTVAYAAGASYTNNAAVTLYAVWKINTYTVKYDANGGTGAPATQTKTHGTALTLSSTKPTRTGYTFQGWATSAASTTVAYAAGASYTNNAAVTLYAVWKINTYTVKYDANGGTGAPAAETKTHGTALTLSGTKPTRAGYTFIGWSTSAASTTVAYAAGAGYTTDANITLYAVWKEIPQKLIIMKKELNRAYVDGGVYLTTDYGNGNYAMAKSMNGTYVLPLRCIGEAFDMRVDYLGSGKTKLTNAAGDYIVVTRDSNVIEKYDVNNNLINSFTADFATFTESSITYVPMRAVSEALGLGVSYIGSGTTGHGSYVAISTDITLNLKQDYVLVEIAKAYALGL